MLNNLLASGLWNNPVLFGLLIGGIVLVAVGLILYFLVFKKRISKGLDARKANKALKREKYAESTSLAASVFQEREDDEKARQERKEADSKDYQDRINAAQKADINARNFGPKPENK
ncbi:MAG: hypothetical protein FWE16_03275 [Firmicutes bacterium]|nr:hypothetical protein [Bacillota bacterium]